MERPENLGLNMSHESGLNVGYGNVCWLLTGLSAGALLMYLFDPDGGRGRRAKLADQLSSKVNDLGEVAQGRAKDLGNRAKGVMHEVKSMMPGGSGRTSDQPASQAI
jgi:hypothetical protein